MAIDDRIWSRAGAKDHADEFDGHMDLPLGREVSVDDKYGLDEGLVFLSGIHALVRVVLEQMRADRRAGLDTGTMVSGYQGSPLGGFDKELARVRKLREELGVVHRPALNEELGATSVWGSQLAPSLPRPTHEGVLGVWYGKAPGVDRAADSLRHGNFVGAHPKGGLLALCGDDPSCKSSTLPSATEATLASFGMPVVFPGNVQEVLDLGLHAIAASRASGLWVGLKVATNVADAVGTAFVGGDRVKPVMPEVEWEGRPYVHVPSASLLAPASLEMERTLMGPRQELARAYARLNRLNRLVVDPSDAWLGIVTAGTAYHDLREALRDMGLGEDDLRRFGIRILKLGMISPLEPGIVRDFARGLQEVLVVEEKGPFVETAVKDVLYDMTDRPRVLGKRDEEGMPLVPVNGALDADSIARAVAHRLRRKGLQIESVDARLAALDRTAPEPVAGAPSRTPFFCSGCPHNRSTDAPADATVGLGIGCHTMVLLNQTDKGNVTGLTQMGGEGTQWIGQAPFTGTEHIFQNLGDGTFHHSGSLAIRAAVAAGVNITYKLLYNGTVAMTGGQDVEGGIPVPDLTRWLQIEGVKRIVVTSDEPGKYDDVTLAPIAEVRDRSELMRAQKELSKVPGVTVLIHDQHCAAEKRRLRKKGLFADPVQRVAINERVCEGCGDCGQKSDCLSVLPVETEFGRKTRIHQASCNKDYSCIEGDCPSFLTVVPGKKAKKALPTIDRELPLPEMLVGDEATVRMIGIGGTGVVTVAQVLGMAAMLDGKQTRGLDQTGLAQKGGAVISDVRIFPGEIEGSNKAGAAGVDAYLGFDLLGAATPKNLLTADPERTVAVVSTSQVPTGSMVVDPAVRFAELEGTLDAIDRHTRRDRNVFIDAQALSEALFGDHMPTNTILLGAAWQRGLLPISLRAMEEAIRLNGAAVEKTLAAFHWGRATVAAPDLVEAATRVEEPVAPELSEEARAIVASVGAPAGSELERMLEVRVPELIAYQSRSYAQSYADFVARALEREDERTPGRTQVAEAVARQLYKLMAYKDEYEVARLHLDPVERARIRREFGEDAKIAYNLHPPVLRALGIDRKIKLGRWFDLFFRMLAAMKFLRGTKLDLFGLPKVRRVERALPREYRELVERALERLDESTHETVAALADAPEVVRGYEEIKLRNVEVFRQEARSLMERLESGPALPLTLH